MEEILIPILVPLGLFALLFGWRYLVSKENMAMLQNGLNPKAHNLLPQPYQNLKWGLLLMGAGLGLFLAYIFDNYVLPHNGDNEAIYFALVAFFGGLGLIISYLIEKKEIDK